uniref:Uncharacterized protein n=1 Tax=Candidatus Kentrum sp. LPFa TaxID=2126335 RepID=A0A450WN51_9GAMM|nr:MAG: hypothetical protein BECKLPF1236A_GA0070988_101972 [Candidatus Kentron sp. LPFa]VFK32719.1 MAG: hypothetical protein BECKLPF1236C_GA0070990_101788 [Candidatus Kentron sp. LPFa]
MKKMALIVAGMFLSLGALGDVQDTPEGSGHNIRAFQVVDGKVFFFIALLARKAVVDPVSWVFPCLVNVPFFLFAAVSLRFHG